MDIYPGRIVKSKAGRDKDKYFAVVSVIDDNFCYIADGDLRKVDVPKRKKIKHLRVTEYSSKLLEEKLAGRQNITNSMIRKELQTIILDD